ncbi:hypothetical protein FOL46_009804, partial [Perkinsus olseni]
KGGPPGAVDDRATLLDGQRAAASLLEVNPLPMSEGTMQEGYAYSRCVQPIASAASASASALAESDYARSLSHFLIVCIMAAAYSRFLAAYCGVPQKINRSWQHWIFTSIVALCGAIVIHRICRPTKLWVTAATPFAGEKIACGLSLASLWRFRQSGLSLVAWELVYSLIQMVVGAIPLSADADTIKSAPALGVATIILAASALGILMTRYAYYHVDCVARLLMGIVFLVFLWLRTPPGYYFHLHHYLHCTLLALAFGRVKGEEVPAIAQAILIGMALQGAAVWGTDSLYDKKAEE